MLIEMFIKGVMIDPATNMPIVILRDETGEHTLPIWVGPVEANAIALQVENVVAPRPMTHDVLCLALSSLGATLNRVIITDLRDGVFFAYLCLDQDGKSIYVDVRPSDAIAAALRAKAPVLVESAVLKSARTLETTPSDGERERLQRWLESLDPDELGYKM